MKIILLSTAYGLVAFNQNNEALRIIYRDLNAGRLAKVMIMLEHEEIPENLGQFIEDLKSFGYNEFLTEEPYIAKVLAKLNNRIKIELIEPDKRTKTLRKFMVEHLASLGLSITQREYEERAKIMAEYIASKKVSERSAELDAQIKEAVETINELDRTINAMSARLREWYGLHFPELTDKIIEDHYKFAKFVNVIGHRKEITPEKLSEIFGPPPKGNAKESPEQDEQINLAKTPSLILLKSERSMGGDLRDKDVATIQQLAKILIDLFDYRTSLEQYIADTLEIIAPNLKAVLGSQIAGKLIAAAGSLERLAHLPSSTIQLLGAEKALFKALRSGGKTPKYGLLFQWHKIRAERPEIRGKIARMVAGKISILARVDYFKGDFIGDKYAEMIDKKIKYIRETTPINKKQKIVPKNIQKKQKRPKKKGNKKGKGNKKRPNKGGN